MMDKSVLKTDDDSLRRCNAREWFLDRFYENFLSSSPIVREKFARTDFERQMRALRASLHLMVLAAEDEGGRHEKYLKELAFTHSKAGYDIGAGLYDLWLDSILKTVKKFDPKFSPEIEKAWESVMMVGIDFMLAHYNSGGGGHRIG